MTLNGEGKSVMAGTHVPSTAPFCGSCGSAVAGTRYCPNCGAPTATEQPTAVTPTVTQLDEVPPHVTAPIESLAPRGRRFQPTGGHASQPPAAPPMGSSHRRWPVFAAVGALVAAAAAAAAILLLAGSDQASPSAQYHARLTSSLSPLVAANARLSEHLSALQPTAKTSGVARPVAQAVKALDQARGAVGATVAPRDPGSRSLQSETSSALDAESRWLEVVGRAAASPLGAQASALGSADTELSGTLRPLASSLPAFAAGPGHTDNLMRWISRRKAKARTASSLKGFAGSVGSLLTRSAPSYEEIQQVFSQMQAAANGDDTVLTPTEASSKLGDVISNRSALAAAARTLDPPTALGRQVRNKLATAFDLSLQNDRDIQKCLDEGRIDQNLAFIFQSCLDASGTSAGAATAAKQDFREAYNRMRHKLGMPATNPSF